MNEYTPPKLECMTDKLSLHIQALIMFKNIVCQMEKELKDLIEGNKKDVQM